MDVRHRALEASNKLNTLQLRLSLEFLAVLPFLPEPLNVLPSPLNILNFFVLLSDPLLTIFLILHFVLKLGYKTLFNNG